MTAVIVEDESLSAQHLRKILESIADIQVIAQHDSIDDTVEWFSSNPEPDVLFLDIHLADGSAFDLFTLTGINCPIIFTTAYDEYALSAFEVNSISYLLKPIKEEGVRQALSKLKNLQKGSSPSPDMEKLAHLLKRSLSSYKSHFLVSIKGEKLLPLKTDDIAYITIESGVVKAFTYDTKVYYMDQTLDELIEQMNPNNFYRVNRQYIIARKAVKDIDHWFQSRLSVNLIIPVTENILISRAKVSEFKNWFTSGDS